MSDKDVHYMELLEVSKLIQSRKLSSVEVTQAQLDRIAKLDTKLKSYVTVMADKALKEAKMADEQIAKGAIKGPLHGVPVAVKDLCWTDGEATTFGMPIFSNNITREDGTVPRKLREAGAVILGKVQLTEGALTDHHPDVPAPVNPWNADHWSGVSSSGSGVAPAAGLCYGAIGTDTGGSIRYPSSACGLSGIKPTWGRVSRYGAFELAATLDHLGPMNRSAADAGAMLGAIAGADVNDPTASLLPVPNYLDSVGKGIKGMKIGVDTRYISDDVDGPTTQMMEHVLATIKGLGAEMREIRFPDYRDVLRNWFPLCSIEAAVVHEKTYAANKSKYGPAMVNLIESGMKLSGMDYQKIILDRLAFKGRVEALFQDVDLLLVPTIPIQSPTVKQMAVTGQEYTDLWYAMMRYTAPFDMTGSPTITLPGGFTSSNAPLGFQFVAPHFREELLVQAGDAYQSATDWHKRHPDL